MKNLLMTTVLLLSVAVGMKAQQVSGKVMDAQGAVEGATVVEVDKRDRVLNQTTTDGNGLFLLPVQSNRNKVRVTKNGYKQITEPINGRTMVRITMPSKKIVDVNSLQTVKKPRGEDSKAIVEGHAINGQASEQWVRLEQLTDTSYIFAIALASKPQAPTYPAGRGLLFLDIADRRILRAKCIADSYPVVGTGETPDLESIIHGDGGVPTTSGDLQFRANQTTGHSPKYWQVPCFEISDKGLEMLLEKGRDLFRVAIEVPDADGYWFVYPSEGWETELSSIISRIRKNR